MNIWYNDAGHLTKMADTPIYGKNPQFFFSQEPADWLHETLHVASRRVIIRSNDDLSLTLDYFTTRPKLVIKAFV